jgi:hypothetical protein
MHVANGHDSRNGGEAVIVTDKRGQGLKPSQGEGDWLPISELGSKAIYQVHAKQFIAVTP